MTRLGVLLLTWVAAGAPLAAALLHGDPQAPAAVSETLQHLPQRVEDAATKPGSVSAGCGLCRDGGNCSAAMNDTSAGVFCGDLHTSAASTQPCCCPYWTECRITSASRACECGGAWPFAAQLALQQRERLTSAANGTQTRGDALDVETMHMQRSVDEDEMALSTEILLHLSAYLALFVVALYVDQWVDCLSDFRRNEMVAYDQESTKRPLRWTRRFGKRRRDSEMDGDSDSDDHRPLLVVTPKADDAAPIDAPAPPDPPSDVVVVAVPLEALRGVGDGRQHHKMETP